MRQKRAKAYKKQMATYERNFGFRHPYQILYTADFLEAARGFHLDAIAGTKRTVQGDVKTMITQCCIKELYDQKADPSIRLAKTMERRRCGHVEAPETPLACVAECVGTRNKNRYIVATQDVKLREKLRAIPGVPLIYINRSVMILEPPSPATLMMKEEREKAKVGLSAEEAVVLGKRKRPLNTGTVHNKVTDGSTDLNSDIDSTSDVDEDDDRNMEVTKTESNQNKKKRKGIPGPNPLSIKKSKSIQKPTSESKTNEALGNIVVGTNDLDEPKTSSRARRKRKHKRKPTETTTDGTTVIDQVDSRE